MVIITQEQMLRMLTSDELPPIHLDIKRIIFDAPYTIVLWKDETKTIVKVSEKDFYDRFTGLALCVLKKEIGDIRYQQFKEYARGVIGYGYRPYTFFTSSNRV